MDFNFRGRSWAGNIYHRFETMCQEVDDFVTKDSVKYVENQVQTVGESMKKIYSNVVHDFLPPVADSEANEEKLVTEKQNDVFGTYIRSMVGFKGKHEHANKRKSFREQASASEVVHQRQQSLPSNLTFQQQSETDLYCEGGSKNAKVVHEENVKQEASPASRFSSSQDEESSLNLEQQSISESSDSPGDENISRSTEILSEGDEKSTLLTNCSSETIVNNVDLIFQNGETGHNTDDHSEEAKTGLSLERDGANAMYKNEKMVPEGNATKKEVSSEGASSLEEKVSSELTSCTKEQYQMADDSHFQQDKNPTVPYSTMVDFNGEIQGKLSPVVLGDDTGASVVEREEASCDSANPSEEAGSNLSSEQDNAATIGTGLEENVAKDVPLRVECKSFSKDKSHLKLLVCSRQQCPLSEESRNLEDKNFNESAPTPNSENPKVTIQAKFPTASLHDQGFKDFEEDKSLLDNSKEEKGDLCLEIDGDSKCMHSDSACKKKQMLTKHADSISSRELESSSNLSLYPTKLHLQAEKLDSLKGDDLLKFSPPLCDKDHKNNSLTNFSQAVSLHDSEVRAFQTDETICSPDPSSELVSSNFCIENKIADTEVTPLNSSISVERLNLSDILYSDYSQKVENSSTNSGSCGSHVSSMSSGSFSDLAGDNKAVNTIPAIVSRSFSALSDVNGDHSGVDIDDPDMETIDLSDEVNLDESCTVVDNRLPYAASSRPRKLRSYKKLFQDAFTSRKRLIKEYEQLAIWYGDIEAETFPHPKQSPLPTVTGTTSSSRTSQTRDTCELGWELL